MTDLYHRIEGEHLRRESHPRSVVHWRDGKAVNFLCPCGQRSVYVTSPPHSIDFASDGTLRGLGGSCGYNERPAFKGRGGKVISGHRPRNWCHFTITDGMAAMHGDSKCPGGDGSIP